MTADAPDDLVRMSRATIRAGSKSFAAAATLFDKQTRASVHLLYAWCRHCDDVIDGQDLGFRPKTPVRHDPGAALDRLRRLTNEALDGQPMRDPVFAAFQRVIAAHRIPHRHAFELLDGFAMDVEGRRYESIEDTLSYCYHVAGVVGVMMAMIMGLRDDDTLDRANDLGMAFQLTNIVRDIVEDATAGRHYLPRQWLVEAGITPEQIAEAQHRDAVFRVAQRMLALAEPYYDSSLVGVARLPLRSAWAVATARVVYRGIGERVLRRGPRAWDQRVSTSRLAKIGAVARGAGMAVAVGPVLRTSTTPGRAGLWTRPRN